MSDDLSDAAERGRDKQGPRGLSNELSDAGDESDSEKEPTTRFTVDLPDSLHRQFKIAAAEDNQSMKDLMITALQQYLRQR